MTKSIDKYITLLVAIFVSMGIFIGATTLFMQSNESRELAQFATEFQIAGQPLADELNQLPGTGATAVAEVQADVA